jgi:hypothetical protein
MIQGLLQVKDVRHGSQAPSHDWHKYGRPYEKHPGLGAKAGVFLESQRLLWQDDPVWDSQRGYNPQASPILETKLKNNENNPDHALELSSRQWVMPEQSLLVQDYTLKGQDIHSFFYHATFAPWLTNPNAITNPDSGKAGFAALYCAADQTLMWFFPKKSKANRLGQKHLKEQLSPSQGPYHASWLDEVFPDGGVFLALAATQPLTGWQVGADRRGRRVSAKAPVGGREDAQDGRLEQNSLFVGPVDAALHIELDRSGKRSKNKHQITLLTAIADNAQKAADMVAQARRLGGKALAQQAITAEERRQAKIRIPQKASHEEKRVARRSIQNLFVGRDSDTGAIVAAPTRQPFYACDWPRDGAFYDLALDLAGLSPLVDKHLDFYRKTQRQKALSFSPTWLINLRLPWYKPRGHWYANMNTDGSPGFFKIIPIEIDETSLMVWDIWRHEQFVREEDKENYRKQYRETVQRAMAAIMPYVDSKRGWTRKIMEDDNHQISATLHGASAVLTALSSGADMARRWKFRAEQRKAWSKAAKALRNGMLERVQDPKTLEDAGWRGIQWSLFPAPLFENYQESQSRPFLNNLIQDLITKVIYKQGGVGYLGEQLFMFCLSSHRRNKEEIEGTSLDSPLTYGELKKRVLDLFINTVPMEGTDCYGELGLWRTVGSETFIQNRTSIPHLWNGVTAFLAIEAFYQPEKVLAMRPPIPE